MELSKKVLLRAVDKYMSRLWLPDIDMDGSVFNGFEIHNEVLKKYGLTMDDYYEWANECSGKWKKGMGIPLDGGCVCGE